MGVEVAMQAADHAHEETVVRHQTGHEHLDTAMKLQHDRNQRAVEIGHEHVTQAMTLAQQAQLAREANDAARRTPQG